MIGHTPLAFVSAVAIREKAYIAAHARPIPDGPQKRRLGELADPTTHLAALDEYLALAPHLIPLNDPILPGFHLWHPDLHSKNIFVSPYTNAKGKTAYKITDIIDWQHAVVAPLYLQARPSQFIAELVPADPDDDFHPSKPPALAEGFKLLPDGEEKRAIQATFERRGLMHMYYVASMHGSPGIRAYYSHPMLYVVGQPTHLAACTWGSPWTMEIAPFRSALVDVVQQWDDVQSFIHPNSDRSAVSCPVHFDDTQVESIAEQLDKWRDTRAFLEGAIEQVGIDQLGFVTHADFADAKKRNDEALREWQAYRPDGDISPADRALIWPFQDGANDLI